MILRMEIGRATIYLSGQTYEQRPLYETEILENGWVAGKDQPDAAERVYYSPSEVAKIEKNEK